MSPTKWTREALVKSASKYNTVKDWRLSEPVLIQRSVEASPELTMG